MAKNMYYCMYCWLCMVKESIESLIHLGRCIYFTFIGLKVVIGVKQMFSRAQCMSLKLL